MNNDAPGRQTISRARTRCSAPRAEKDTLKERRTQSLTPEPVPGRQHTTVQTKSFVDVLGEAGPGKEMAVQTEPSEDCPDPRLFPPVHTGVSVATEIGPGDLFDFDREVAPILEVLVAKTCDQAVMDVVSEEELKAIERQQVRFEQMRNVEVAELQRLEAREARFAAEKHRRLEQERERRSREVDVARKMAARTVAKNTLDSMQQVVLGTMVARSAFVDPVVDEVEHKFIPWLSDAASNVLDEAAVSRQVTEGVVLDALAHRRQQDDAITEERQGLLQTIEEERRRMAELARQQQEAAAAAAAASAASASAAAEQEQDNA
ncbi:Radial spoke protein 3 [Plasmodiophora brassicae]